MLGARNRPTHGSAGDEPTLSVTDVSADRYGGDPGDFGLEQPAQRRRFPVTIRRRLLDALRCPFRLERKYGCGAKS
jgi:hypothetical protein